MRKAKFFFWVIALLMPFGFLSSVANAETLPPFLLDDQQSSFKKVSLMNPWSKDDNVFISKKASVPGEANVICTERFSSKAKAYSGIGTRAGGTIYVATYGSNGYFVSENVPAYSIRTFNGYYWHADVYGEVYGEYTRSHKARTQWVFSVRNDALNIWNANRGTGSVLLVEGTSYGTVGGMYEVNSTSLAYTYDCRYNSTGEYFRRSGYSDLYLGLNSSAGNISNQSSLTNNVYVTLEHEIDYDCPKSISLGSTSRTLEVGGSVTYTLDMTSIWEYSISNTDVISFSSVSGGFKITALREGTSTFTFTNRLSGASASVRFTVTSPNVRVQSVSLNKTSNSVVRKTSDYTFTLSATVSPSNATNKSVTWSTSNSSVATVSSSGTVTCKYPGTATITCTSVDNTSAKATCAVTVKQAVTGISISSSTGSSMEVGTTKSLTASITPSYASSKSVTWSSDNTSVATVSSSGVVTAKAAGSATIKCLAADGYGAYGTYTVYVSAPTPTSLDIDFVSMSTSDDLTKMTPSSTLTMTGKFKNNGTTSVNLRTSLGVMTSDLSKVLISTNSKEVYISAGGTGSVTHELTLSELEPGNYKTMILYYDPYDETWYYSSSYLKDLTVVKASTGNTCYLYSSSTTIMKNQTAIVPIYLYNTTPITSFQFDLYLPSGVTVATDSWGDYDISIGSRSTASRHTVAMAKQADGAYRVVCYSPNNNNFSDNSGDVLKINLKATSSASGGSYTAYIRNQILSTTSLESFNPSDRSFSLTVKDYIPGDVNGDGVVTIVDVTAAVNLILGSGSSGLIREAADMNGDGQITVVDVTAIVNIVLSGSSRASMNANFSVPSFDRIKDKEALELPSMTAPEPNTVAVYIDDITIDAGEQKEIQILMNNPGDQFTGLQFDLYLPKGLTIATDEFGDVMLNVGSRTNYKRHTVASAMQADGALRVVAYSNNNSLFTGESGDILLMGIKATSDFIGGDVTLKKIILSRPDNTGFDAKDYTAKASTSTGILSVDADNQASSTFFDLSGRKLDGNTLNRRGVVLQRNNNNGKAIKVIKK